jgi:hypothetical protein
MAATVNMDRVWVWTEDWTEVWMEDWRVADFDGTAIGLTYV